MSKNDLRMLFKQALLEAGVLITLNEENKLIHLSGIHILKAMSVIYFHPLVVFITNQIKSIYPNVWKKAILNEDAGRRKDRTEDAYRLQQTVKQNIKLGEDSLEFQRIEEYFHKSMDKERFEVTKVTRIQMPLQYKTYYFNRKYFIEKKNSNKEKVVNVPNNQNEENKQPLEEDKQQQPEEEDKQQQPEEEDKQQQPEEDKQQQPEEDEKQQLEENKGKKNSKYEQYEKYYPFKARMEDTNEDFIVEEEKGPDNHEEEQKEDSTEFDTCQPGEKFLFLVPRTTLNEKKGEADEQEYQKISD